MIPFPPPPLLLFAVCGRCRGWFPVHPARQPCCPADPVTGRLFYDKPAAGPPGRLVQVPVCPVCAVLAGPARERAGLPPLPEQPAGQ